MGSMINISVTGYVGSEPQTREVGDQRVTTFSVAVNRKVRSGEQTLWVRVNCWNKLADVANGYLKTGSLVQIQASWMRPSAYIDREGKQIDKGSARLVKAGQAALAGVRFGRE